MAQLCYELLPRDEVWGYMCNRSSVFTGEEYDKGGSWVFWERKAVHNGKILETDGSSLYGR